MKCYSLWFAALLAWVVPASAQVNVDLVMEQEQYLPGETLMVGVRITNLSGQTLQLGKSQDWILFSVEARDNDFIVSKDNDPPVEGEFTLQSSMVATRSVDIAPYFNLNRVGRYRVTATVKIDQWERTIVSTSKWFDIISGVRMWEQTFGVSRPEASGENAAPEVRKYILQRATYLKQLRLYVRITDTTETRTFRVYPLCKVLSFGRPEAYVDRSSNLHVLNQIGPQSFLYCVINPDGILAIRQTHDYTATSRPTLKVNAEGMVRVVGGQRQPAIDDLPTLPRFSSPESQQVEPSKTNAPPATPTADPKSKKKKTDSRNNPPRK
jgi:hypothetical protein